jgi:hypothetical protein
LSLNRDWTVHLQINEYKLNGFDNIELNPVICSRQAAGQDVKQEPPSELDEEKQLKDKQKQLEEKLSKKKTLELKKLSKLNI